MNNYKSFSSNLGQYLLLMRLNNLTGWLLLFYPCLMTLVLYKNFNQQSIQLVILLALCSLIIRTVGCIINDLIDKDLDSKVERTKLRPLAAGTITSIQAFNVLTILLLVEFFLVIHLPFNVGAVSFCLFPTIIIYPLLKRFTYLPQLFLGCIFNFGTIITFIAMNISFKPSLIVLYVACVLWTISYDTIYGFADHIYDKKINVKSTALLIENKNYKLILAIGYILCIIFLLWAKYLEQTQISPLSALALIIIVAIFYWQSVFIAIEDSVDCIKKFKSNNIAGLFMVLFLLF